MGDLSGEMIALTTAQVGGANSWQVLMMPATEVPVEELPDELVGADRVSRVKDARGDNFVAWFPKRLKGYLAGAVPGRREPIKEGARSIWYRTSIYGAREAERLSKRHLKRVENRRAVWKRLVDAETGKPDESENEWPLGGWS